MGLPVSIAITVVFLGLDLAFVAANLGKIEAGGILPIGLAAAIVCLAVSWRIGQMRMASLQEGEEPGLREYLKACGNRAAHDEPLGGVPGPARGEYSPYAGGD